MTRVALRRVEIATYIQDCADVYDYEDHRGGGISIGMGPNYCPAALLYHPNGYTAVVRTGRPVAAASTQHCVSSAAVQIAICLLSHTFQ